MSWMKWSNTFLSLFTVLAIVLLPMQPAQANRDPKINALIIYSTEESYLDENVYILDQLLSHYMEIDIKADKEVTQLSGYDYIVYIGTVSKQLESTLLDQIINFPNSVMFIGHNVNQFKQRLDLRTLSHTIHIKEISFQDNMHRAPFNALKEIQFIKADSSNISLIEGWRGTYNYPLFVSVDKDTYLATHEISGLITDYLAKALPAVFQLTNNSSLSFMFIKLEDIHPATDVTRLTQLTSYLISKNIPVILAISPIHENQDSNKITYFSDSPELLRKIVSLQEMGASVVYSYPNFSENTVISDKKRIIEEQMQELASFNIYPVAVSFSNEILYVEQEDLNLVDSFFTTVLSEGKLSNSNMFKYTPPYITKPSYLGRVVWFPETLGYIDLLDVTSLFKMKHRLSQLELIPSATLGLTFHSYLELDNLKTIVAEMESLHGTKWLELKEWEHSVTVPFVTIHSKKGGIVFVENEIPFFKGFMYKHHLSYLEITLWILAFIVALVILIFSIFTFHLKLQLRKTLFSERKING